MSGNRMIIKCRTCGEEFEHETLWKKVTTKKYCDKCLDKKRQDRYKKRKKEKLNDQTK